MSFPMLARNQRGLVKHNVSARCTALAVGTNPTTGMRKAQMTKLFECSTANTGSSPVGLIYEGKLLLCVGK